MIEITKEILQKDIDKYIELGQKEEIHVIHNGELIFTIVPRAKYLTKELESLFGILPREALYDDDIDRE